MARHTSTVCADLTGIFFCETDRRENNGMKFIDAEDCVSIDIMMVTDIMEDDVRKTAR